MRVLIVHNEHGHEAEQAADAICQWLGEHNHGYVVASKHGSEVPGVARPDGTGPVGYDLAIAIGGDGTILRRGGPSRAPLWTERDGRHLRVVRKDRRF